MCGASLCPGPRDSTSFVRVSERKSLGPDLALRETRDRDGGQKYTAAANMHRRNPRVLSLTMRPTEFPERTRRLSSALFETAHLPPAMFPVSISYCVAYYYPSNMSRAKSGCCRRATFEKILDLSFPRRCSVARRTESRFVTLRVGPTSCRSDLESRSVCSVGADQAFSRTRSPRLWFLKEHEVRLNG
jgi:hypothetical protein